MRKYAFWLDAISERVGKCTIIPDSRAKKLSGRRGGRCKLIKKRDVAAGAAQLHRVFQTVAMDPETFHGRGHTRLKQIEYLLKTGQVDQRLFWKEMQ